MNTKIDKTKGARMLSKKNWMMELESYYEKTRGHYPNDKLMIMFDIDGTILDMRYMILYVLKAYDKCNKTKYFRGLNINDINNVHENRIDLLMERLQISFEHQISILEWYKQHRWSSEYILQSHQPFSGVLEVVRWFQIQPNTYVGLNTGRPESSRDDTLKSLNRLGKEFKVNFCNEFLHMNPNNWEEDVQNAKTEGVVYFQEKGYRIFAFVDNEPDNLKAISRIDNSREILLLHADTIFESKRSKLPLHTVKGKTYHLTDLIPEKALPRHVQFVWHGINDEYNLRQFLSSDIAWGECDIRMNPMGKELILRHDSFVKTPLGIYEEWMDFSRLLNSLKSAKKSLKIDMKAGGVLIDKIIELVKYADFNDSNLWFNGNVERLQEHGFKKIANEHQDAIIQCPVDFLAPLICSVSYKAKEVLDMFVDWGINRFSINWQISNIREFFDQMDKWGFEVNIYNVPDLESFLQAVLLLPRSITSDFNFPQWHYFGRGSGENGDHHEYSIRKSNKKKKAKLTR